MDENRNREWKFEINLIINKSKLKQKKKNLLMRDKLTSLLKIINFLFIILYSASITIIKESFI